MRGRSLGGAIMEEKDRKILMQRYAELANAIYSDRRAGRIQNIRLKFERFSYYLTDATTQEKRKTGWLSWLKSIRRA